MTTAHDVLVGLNQGGLDTRPDELAGHGWEADCPVCNHLSDAMWPLRITERSPGGPVVLRCISGCAEADIIAGLGKVPAWRLADLAMAA